MEDAPHHRSPDPGDIENGETPAKEAATRDTRSDGSWRSRAFLLGPVDKKHGDLILLAHSAATGMVDAACFSNWAVFAGMQTGNTVLLALATASTPNNPHAWLTTLVSIVSYLLGAFLTFRLTAYLVPAGAASNRLYLFSLLAVQALLILIPAALVAADLVPHNPPGIVTHAVAVGVIEDVRIVALLPPLAFQAGVQIATSRLLGYNELPVNVVTSTYCDIMGDNALLAPHNEKRDRRVAAVVLILVGAVGAAWLMRSSGGLPAALFVAGGIKAVAAVGGFFLMESDEGKVV